jgi:alkanesulfonate monooxygenase SsuD/methylene tetrahydromethanopterin reductase-like flavin-dependent oxidoreductase (luciferase family)
MLALNAVVADSDADAGRLFTTQQQAFVNLRRGMPAPIPPPNERFRDDLQAHENAELDQTLSNAVVGGPDTVRRLEDFTANTEADRLIIVAQIFDHAARLHSCEIVSQTNR